MDGMTSDERDKKRIVSFFITSVIVLALVFSGPAGAVFVGVNIVKPAYNSSVGFINFTVWVDIENGERLPIQNLTLDISGPDDESCKFYPNGNNISGCDNVSIALISSLVNSTGQRYGYDWNNGTNYTFTYGSGFINYTSGNAELRYNVTWNLTAANVSDGNYNATLYAHAGDGVNSHIYSSNNVTNFTIDSAAPKITNVKASDITTSSATITWATANDASDSVVEYGKTTSYGSTKSNTSMVTSHSIKLTGLSANTKYHYRVKSSTDVVSNSAVSSDRTFTTSKEDDGQNGGGLGGGGGGGGAFPTSSNNVPTDNTGRLTSTTTIPTSDGGAKLTLTEGTTALDSDGSPLKSISITPMSVGGTIASFNIGPEGATFKPSITLTVNYDPEDVPEGKVVVIKMYDGTKWTSLETTVDTEASTATVKIGHFTYFALFLEESSIIHTILPPVIPITSAATPTQSPIATIITPTPTPLNWGSVIARTILLAIIGLAAYYYVSNRNGSNRL
ncbi:MAG: fibronectin type III domain-containing protein [Halobacteriota archaeon]|nr:fibronectin type III domain-containing protein [Halobacteriota archaeon]